MVRGDADPVPTCPAPTVPSPFPPVPGQNANLKPCIIYVVDKRRPLSEDKASVTLAPNSARAAAGAQEAFGGLTDTEAGAQRRTHTQPLPPSTRRRVTSGLAPVSYTVSLAHSRTDALACCLWLLSRCDGGGLATDTGLQC